MDDHKSYHDDPPTYEETMAGILPQNSDENTPPRRQSESSASETSTARPGIHGLMTGLRPRDISMKSVDSRKDGNEENSKQTV